MQGRVILAGDFNAHSPRWNKTGIRRDQGFLEKLMDDHDLDYVGNGEPTRGESTIDLVLASSGPLAAAINYQTREEVWHATGADHVMIEWTLNEEEMGEEYRLQTVSRKEGWKIARLVEEIQERKSKGKEHEAIGEWKKEVRKRKALHAKANEEELEKEVEWVTETCTTILQTYAEKANITARSKRWWNNDIKSQRKTLGRTTNLQKKGLRTREDVKREKSQLHKLIR